MDLLAGARSGLVRVSLLGAARTLLAGGDPPDEPVTELAQHTVEMSSPHGRIVTVPPPLTLNNATIERPVTGYAASAAQFAAQPVSGA